MESDPSRRPRKVKFAPNPPPRRPKKPPPQPKCEVANKDDAVDKRNEELLGRKVHDHLTRNRPQAEKKSPVQVVFAPGSSSSSLRTFGKQTEGGSTDKMVPSDRGLDSEQETSDLSPVVNADDIVESSLNSSSDKSKKKEYIEPWDYKNSYYPITLPLRRPNSGDPEILDEEEFGAKGTSMEYDENTKNAALELGLRVEDESDEQRMIFFQLPKKLPLHRHTPGSSVSGGNAMSSNRTVGESSVAVGGDLESQPAGYMGKLVVYKSGAVKWKMGDHLFDVSSGIPRQSPEEVVAINKAEKHCSALGKIQGNAVVTPDFDSLFKD